MIGLIRQCVLVVLLAGLFAPTVAAQQTGRCFAETRQCIEEPFLRFWEAGGGLPVFGLPLTEARLEINRENGSMLLTQWFERTRMEWHQEFEPPQVLLGRTGEDRLLQLGRVWQQEPKAPAGTPGVFSETGQAIAPEFATYWRTHGLELGDAGVSYRESLALFGLPLTAPRLEEVVPGVTVLTQWYERARFEYHPGNPASYTVLLGRLSADVRDEAVATFSGQRISFVQPVSNTDWSKLALYRANNDGSGLTQIFDPARIASGARIGIYDWSPDGKTVVFDIQAVQGAAQGIYLYTPETSALVQVDAGGSGPAWSPDGTSVAYRKRVGDLWSLMVMPIGGTATPIYQNSNEFSNITWSPDSQRLLIDQTSPAPELRIVERSGAWKAISADRNATWSPDGTQIAISRLEGSQNALSVYTLATGETRPLGVGFMPSWGKGGLAVLVATDMPYVSDLTIIDPANNTRRVIGRVGRGLGIAGWSKDGTRLAYLSDARFSLALTTIAADGSQPATLIAYTGNARWIP